MRYLNSILLIGLLALVVIIPLAANEQPVENAQAPQSYIDTHPLDYDIVSFIRYDDMIFTPLVAYHKVNGKMPSSITEFFNSDFCLVHPREINSGQLFVESETLDVNHSEYISYKYIDENSATLKMCLKSESGTSYFFTKNYNRETLWALYPPFREDDTLEKRLSRKPPHSDKKAKEMLNLLNAMFGHAVGDYFDDNNSLPTDMTALFDSKWGEFRTEPWDNFEYDAPDKKLPIRSFGFDRAQNVYYVRSEWEDGFVNEYALRLPVNYISREGKPVVLNELRDYDSLNIEIIADPEILKAM